MKGSTQRMPQVSQEAKSMFRSSEPAHPGYVVARGEAKVLLGKGRIQHSSVDFETTVLQLCIGRGSRCCEDDHRLVGEA